MERIDLSSDIRPLSDFRAEASSCIKHIHNTKRPMLITQRGKGVAVLLDIHEWNSYCIMDIFLFIFRIFIFVL